MSFVTEILTPILQGLAYIFLFGGIVFFFVRLVNQTNLRWWMQYSLFRKKFSEGKVEFCIEKLEKGDGETEIKKIMLLKGKSKREVSEMLYIFKQVKKRMKGGNETKEKWEI